MMTYEMYRYVFIIGAIMAGVMLAVSVLLFFVLKIPTVIGDLNGTNARKGIESIRSKAQTSSGGGTYKARPTGGRNTESFGSKKLTRRDDGSRNTAKISKETPIINETTVLGGTASETTVLQASSNETTVLQAPVADETTVLDMASATAEAPQTARPQMPETPSQPAAFFEVEYDITFIHSDELI